MNSALRTLVFICFVTALAGCAGPGQGVDVDRLVSVSPSQQIGKGPLTPKSLLGVVPGALSLRLGPPAFKRAEPDAEVWQYSGQDCALFVYFYKTSAGSFASTYVDARKTLGGPADTDACLAQVLQKQNVPVS